MNDFILKHYYFNFICDCEWHKIDFLDSVFCKPVAKYFGFSSERNKDGF